MTEPVKLGGAGAVGAVVLVAGTSGSSLAVVKDGRPKSTGDEDEGTETTTAEGEDDDGGWQSRCEEGGEAGERGAEDMVGIEEVKERKIKLIKYSTMTKTGWDQRAKIGEGEEAEVEVMKRTASLQIIIIL